MSLYRALTVQADHSAKVTRDLQMLSLDNLPKNELLVKVEYSVLNYFDALMLDGRIQPASYPFVPGTDAAGVVISSESPLFNPGDEVIVTGFDLGTKLPGSLGGYISVPADWAVNLPMELSMREAMIYGSAGIAAGIAVSDLRNTGIIPGKHKIAVTGASFAAGSVATAILTAEGYEVEAFVDDVKLLSDYVSRLGVKTVKGTEWLETQPDKDIMPPEYDGAYDSIGGQVFASLIRYINNSGTVVFSAIDNSKLTISTRPFTERAINMVGVNALKCSKEVKNRIWQMLSSEWKIPQLDWLCTEISINEVDSYIAMILSRKTKGQIVINHSI